MSILLAQKKTKLKRVFLFCVATLVRFFFYFSRILIVPRISFRVSILSEVWYGWYGLAGSFIDIRSLSSRLCRQQSLLAAGMEGFFSNELVREIVSPTLQKLVPHR